MKKAQYQSAQITDEEYQKLVKQVADQLWKMWKNELRQEQERSSSRQTRK